MYRITFYCCLFFFLLLQPSLQASSHDQLWEKKLLSYVENGAILLATPHKILYSYQANEQLVPASILKIGTALAVMHYLGKEYQFKTEFYLTDDQGILIRGYGDPFLVSEEWEMITQHLKRSARKYSPLIYLDTTRFRIDETIPGVESTLNPYDARNGALVTNFNTIYVEVLANQQVQSAEAQTPLTPIAKHLAKLLSVGKHRINISQQPQYSLPYVGELFREFLVKQGLTHFSTAKIKSQPMNPSTDQLIYSHKNPRNVLDSLAAMLLYSNNFIANQFVLSIGLHTSNGSSTLVKGVRAIEQYFLQNIGLLPETFSLAEGSGISRNNRISALSMWKLLQEFAPYESLLPKKDHTFVKTGTLKGVYTLAGYIPRKEKPSLQYVIMLNQKKNTRMQVLEMLKKFPISS